MRPGNETVQVLTLSIVLRQPWGQASGPNGDWTNYPASGTTVGELSYTFSLGGATLSTSRFTWTSTSIADALLGGLQSPDSGTAVIKSWTYAPASPSVNIPQQPLPLGMNLWCFSSPPSDGKPVEIVIRDFAFVPAGAGGAAGTGGATGIGGAAGVAGRAGTGGVAGMAGAAGAAGRAGTGGAAGAGGAAGVAGAADGGGVVATAGAPGASSPSGTSNSGCSCRAGSSSPERGWGSIAALLLVAGRRRAGRARAWKKARAPEVSRTPNPRLRRPMLYPVELRAQKAGRMLQARPPPVKGASGPPLPVFRPPASWPSAGARTPGAARGRCGPWRRTARRACRRSRSTSAC